MESVATQARVSPPGLLRRVDGRALSIWLLVGALVIYLAVEGGGYDIVVHSQVGTIVWWVVLVGAAWGLLPAGRVSRVGWCALALFGAFAVWTALGVGASASSERSLQELSRVASYLGILLLAITIHSDREQAMRHTLNAVAAAVVLVAALALASRFRPDLFPGAEQTARFLPGTQRRLGWPLNYWNGLSAMVDLGLPLLLAVAFSARTILGQALAAACVPVLALCGFLTFSRGGVLAAAAALVVFLLLSPERWTKLATVLVTGAASAALIAGAAHRVGFEHALGSARAEGHGLLIALLLICAGVALVQAAIGLAVRHATPPRWTRPFQVSPGRARILTGVAVVLCVVVAIAAGAPHRLSHAWDDFKNPTAAVLEQDSISRFGSVSGNGRYDYWKVGVNAAGDHLLKGSGPGTFQLVWLPRAPFYSYVQDAHSLYVQTLVEDGLIGLVLLVAFLLLVLGTAVWRVVSTRHEERVRAAGIAAALGAFCVSAIYEWVWQMPVLPAAFLVLAGAILAPRARTASAPATAAPGAERRGVGQWLLRAGGVVLSLACLAAIAVPLAAATDVRRSQREAASGETAAALVDARNAARVEPSAASPQIQLALVLEVQRKVRQALAAAYHATRDEPGNWSAWLIVSRLEAEAKHPAISLAAYRRARALNPRSPLFRTAPSL